MVYSIIPKYLKQNQVNAREIFYFWSIKNGYPLNVPFIVLSHMKSFIRGEPKDIP